MAGIKTLMNEYLNAHNQRVQAEYKVRDLMEREQVSANRLAVEEAKNDGIEIGEDVFIWPFTSKKTCARCVSIIGYGPGKYKATVAMPKKDGTPGSRRRVYRKEEIEAVREMKEKDHA